MINPEGTCTYCVACIHYIKKERYPFCRLLKCYTTPNFTCNNAHLKHLLGGNQMKLKEYSWLLFNGYLITIYENGEARVFPNTDDLAIYFFDHKEWNVTELRIDYLELTAEISVKENINE